MTENNLKYLRTKYDLKSVEELFDAKNKISTEKFNQMPDEDLWKIDILEKLVHFKENIEETELSMDQVDQLILYITTV